METNTKTAVGAIQDARSVKPVESSAIRGKDISEFANRLATDTLATNMATQRKGNMKFNAGVLWDKCIKEIKSLCSHVGRLPDDVAESLRASCDNIATRTVERLVKDDWAPVSMGTARTNFKYSTGEAIPTRLMKLEQERTFEQQLLLVERDGINTTNQRIKALQAREYTTSDEKEQIELLVTRAEDKLKKQETLARIIRLKIADLKNATSEIKK